MIMKIENFELSADKNSINRYVHFEYLYIIS